MNSNKFEERLVATLQSCCQEYFEHYFKANRFLYYDVIPLSYFGQPLAVEVDDLRFEWLGNPDLKQELHTVKDLSYNKSKYVFTQECQVGYRLKINALYVPGRQDKRVKFYAQTFEPYGNIISPTIIDENVAEVDSLRAKKNAIKEQFKIISLEEAHFRNNEIGFGYYVSIIRKTRATPSLDSKIGHFNVYQEIASCHAEIEECVLNVLYYHKYISDLLGRKVIHEGTPLFLLNQGYMDFQYLLWAGFGFDRLYSFWDRITHLLANFNLEGLDMDRISFYSYFSKLKNKIAGNIPVGFNPQSPHLKWLIDFHEKHYPVITEYRHRIAHYQITPEWEGVLSAKIANNALENVFDEAKLKLVNFEFDQLGHILYQQFNFCIEGFVNALELIDELP